MKETNFDWVSLDENEEVLWSGEPILKSIYPALAIGIPLSIFGIGVIIIVGAYLHIKNTDFVVTSKSVYKKQGVLSRSVKKIDFDKIQNISFSQGFFGKLFDYGNVEISTAGGSGIEMRFQAIEDPKSVQELINDKIRSGKKTGQSQSSRNQILRQILAEMRETRKEVENLNDKL